ncbi:mitochondrial carrier domain-containing protein [Microdochium trichocladiopsis]|uniref:Mitochondrial carrier domain-containing protein n=1 Tax=Microdochium trichocladiopsis TaxID=1682393 RepID=A0A9P9BT48_9PEZI|nr:mitochondrial carrier domain-containing protein [Microdochium trichocladiopsis]KAH7039596.1 mitochondrial carrier domain-containing protein [Microdochium trichocladiopsis]
MSGNPHVDVMLAGAAAAFTVDLLIYPLDTLKTRQQSRDFLKTFADPGTSTKLPSRQLFRGLYQGIGIVVVATLPAAGTFFLTYEAAKRVIGRHTSGLGLPQPAVHSLASSMAECASCLVLTPAEVIKQNAQMIQSKSGGTNAKGAGGGGAAPSSSPISSSTSLAALKQLSRGRGVTSNLLSGYTALVARNLPFTAIQFPIFEHIRQRIWDERLGKSGTLLETGVVTGVSAGLAGSFAAVVTTPMDVVKTRMMLSVNSDNPQGQAAPAPNLSSSSSSSASKPQQEKKGGLAITRQVIAERGIAGLFRGSLIRAVWTAVGSGLYLGMYEVSKVWLTRDGKELEGEGFP